ncbi:MAG: nucleotidyltransferase domain-containing protein [Immundisolibacterales bacterium]|nr:nucleotidyltransferase domain-containing protein [Immundisolibacterales bacterium]
MNRAAILQRLNEFFAESAGPDLIAAWLFGSFARGEARARSDVDVAVLHRSTPDATFDTLPLRLEGEIERVLRRTTQVVAMNRAPADLRVRVLRDGVLLADRDPPLRIRFEVQTRNEWFDLQPILREYRRLPMRPVE